MKWQEKWPRVDNKGLARYVTDEAQRWLTLPPPRPNDRIELIKAIYNALKAKQITYAPEEYHPSEDLQRIRQPAWIVGDPREGTCLDLALFFCGLCFGYDLLPCLIVIKGHALAAVSLAYGRADWSKRRDDQRNYFSNFSNDSSIKTAAPLCAFIDSGAYIAVECTGFAYIKNLSDSVPEVVRREEGFLSFENAVETGRQQLEQKDRPFQFALDIAIAHYGWGFEPYKIKPPFPSELILPEWQNIGGSWTGPDEGGMIYAKTNAFDGDALYLFKNIYSDFWFSAAVQVLQREGSLVVRMSDNGKNGYMVIFIPKGSIGGNPGLYLAKRVNGKHSFPVRVNADYAMNEWVTLRVEAQGPRISVYLNGELVIDFEDKDAPFACGRLGFRCYGEPDRPGEAKFDELSVAQ